MRRAQADELREDAIPVMVLAIREARLRELFPVEFSLMDSLSEAEPSKGALIELDRGSQIVVTYGTVTGRTMISIPVSRNARQEVDAILREIPVARNEIEWIAESASGALRFIATAS